MAEEISKNPVTNIDDVREDEFCIVAKNGFGYVKYVVLRIDSVLDDVIVFSEGNSISPRTVEKEDVINFDDRIPGSAEFDNYYWSMPDPEFRALQLTNNFGTEASHVVYPGQ